MSPNFVREKYNIFYQGIRYSLNSGGIYNFYFRY